MYDDLANATLQIECGGSRGTGFHFKQENIIATNAHVVQPAIQGNFTAAGITESGATRNLNLLDFSLPQDYDFAVLEVEKQFSGSRTVLNPNLTSLDRGDEIIFAGFPHGISDLLVNEAIVSGPHEDYGFYIDGTVNGGNSGGPIVDADSGDVVGLITERRHLTPQDMDKIIQNMDVLADKMRNDVAVDMVMSGISLNQVLQLMGEGFVGIQQAIDANANTGIGIGYYIEYINSAVKSQLGE